MAETATAVQGITYEQYRNQRQAEFSALPLYWAFSDSQFKRVMEDHGFTENDTDQVCSVPGCGGAFCFKSDAGKIREFLEKPDPLPELMKNPVFAEGAFYYEMGNHEYHINHYQGDWEVLNCFSDKGEIPYYGNEYDPEKSELQKYFEWLGWGEELQKCYKKARTRFLRDADENDWY